MKLTIPTTNHDKQKSEQPSCVAIGDKISVRGFMYSLHVNENRLQSEVVLALRLVLRVDQELAACSQDFPTAAMTKMSILR